MNQSPYHPDYGLPQAYRKEVLIMAEQTNIKAAAEAHNLALGTVYKWRRAMENSHGK